MDSLIYVLFTITVSVILLVILSSRYKVHPFLSLIVASLIVGFANGLDGNIILKLITSGFGSILSQIGLLVVFGTILGVLLERSGALFSIANFVSHKLSRDQSFGAMTILGAVVSIPVFCDSGFIILSRMSQLLGQKRNVSPISMSLSLAAGLYTTHTLVPPTPGPIAVTANLGIADHLGTVILMGLITSIPVLFISSKAAAFFGKRIAFKESNVVADDKVPKHSFVKSIFPIALPIVLIALGSLISFLYPELGKGHFLFFVTHPVMALLISCILAMLIFSGNLRLEGEGALVKEAIVQAGPILLITGAGGAFGTVLKGTALSNLLSEQFVNIQGGLFLLIFVGFLLSALLKTAQGSSTSALVISSALLAPIAVNLGVNDVIQLSLLTMGIGGGAMTVSHSNDSYFWVVTQFSNMNMEQGYKTFTLLTLIQGLSTLAIVLVMAILVTIVL
ncbi:MAG: GntP family permease [Bacteroidota bacterium]